ncbi:MAG: LOG family protein, partial [Patescibacteria group bacterium]
PGIMEAANKGAFEAGAESVGLDMRVDHSERHNKYVRKSMGFFFPFTRKLIISAPSLAFVVFPGGFGTMHQLFELLTLVQTGKMGKIPVILFGKKFWAPLDKFIREVMYKKFKAISEKDLDLYQIVDTVDEARKIIKDRPRTKF